jgi:biotin-dependent carboxylase-like uncharacterized protein
MKALRVLSPGLHTTVQDLGRFGAQYLGVPVSGALDSVNLRLANLLVRNEEKAGALEMIGQGACFEVLAETARLAVGGPDARVEPVGKTELLVPKPYESFTLKKGDRFQINLGAASSVCYLAVEGGFDVPCVMGSCSTFVLGEMGGFNGRRLLEGDEIRLNRDKAPVRSELRIENLNFSRENENIVRVMLGPQDDYFDAEAIDLFLSKSFTISHQSDRMGFRLSGVQLKHSKGFNIVSDGIAPGAIQVPGSGEPIILLADRQTTGGYPKIGVVISTDLPMLGRFWPGETISFKAVSFDEAREAAHELQAWLSNARRSMIDAKMASVIDLKALSEQNLVDGVINAKQPHLE